MLTNRSLIILALTSLTAGTGPALGQAPTAAPAAKPGERTVQVLAEGWRFKLEGAASGPEQPGFDDAGWATVAVPHTWNRVGYYREASAERLNRPETINKTMGVGWYRLSFAAPRTGENQRLWLEFDAASRVAEVWLNGVRLGAHTGGFSRFRFDATAAVRPGQANLLAVRVDNSRPAAGAATADALPLAGDFFVHGGLYRPVRLITTNAVHVDMLDHGGSGIAATTVALSPGRAEVLVATKLRNAGTAAAAVTLTTRLLDQAGRTAAMAVGKAMLAAGGTASRELKLAVSGPRLWQGTADPYLYSLVVDVRADGKLVDRVVQPYGLRQMRFDAARGLLLNGKPYPLYGVGYHQDREGKGWAVSADDIAQDLAIIREMGANSIRLTHYQHGQPVHDLADRYGLVLWDEIPLVSQWTLGGAKTASPGLLANARQQLQELVAQNRNHASVAAWGIANEVDFGNSLPLFLTGGTGAPPDPTALLEELAKLARQLDPAHPSALATCCEGRLFAPGVEVPITATTVDLAGANRYFGWYYGKPDDLGPALDALHALRPRQPLALTEYGAGGAITLHTDNPLAGPPDSRGRKQPEEVESLVHEVNWQAIKARPYLGASWLWVAFDFASTVRQEGDAEDINTKGLVTYDRRVRKDAWYFYKANWSAEPTVHITGRRYVDRAYPVTDVRVYTNAFAPTLSLNGQPVDQTAQCANRICVWRDVRLVPGSNVLTASGQFAGRTVVDTVTWQLDAAQARAIRIDAGALLAAKSSTGRFGSDTFFVGGEAASVDRPADYGKPEQPTPIAATADRELIATYRSGRFAYQVPLANGRYRVRLTFVEPSRQPVERLFDVVANGTPVLTGVNVAALAGAPLTALQREVTVEVQSGRLELAFRPTRGAAVVSAIEIEPA
ncbi:glycoside hydrolase family 2 TIM barrel-domain containing protein [Novosphingobium piscinae]|uniref:Glycoside hydrolase family 2 n=1 Tax=Novosphingobium piscinae TaxID=1507448 RepID=A0A7X1KPW1_9SPHN|nr:glycoside hydrolase family 2 TIM barrel-domain containing protein [Novosphingobium piscinae]MBC2668878.1 glycoside hydrolase family 2 [Novosphingobium piscinae]